MVLIRVRPAAVLAAVALGLAAVLVGGPLRAALRERLGAVAVTGAGGRAERVRVVLREYRIAPELVRVPAGTRVEVALSNRGRREHGLEIEGLGFGIARLAPGQAVTFTFLADRPGAYRLRCGRPGHGELGMTAWLVVERR